jgi:4-amino-4-deoxy-L-arabinose transferase-like glycosyltransferase
MRLSNAAWLHVALLLGTLWLVGIATRSVWTPDEPREYALSVNMLGQSQHAVPMLGARPFAEKPPLTYWAAAGAMSVLGRNPIAARVPNLIYGLIAVLCTAWLAASMLPSAMRREGAIVAAVISGTAWLSFLHTIWLATDAPLLAGSALAILGAWLGPTANDERSRTLGYLLFHLGLAAAFLAKNLLGLIAPVLALGLFLFWDRRWREFLRWQLWAGLVLSLGLISMWLLTVSRQPDGAALLRIFLWENSVGRFLPVQTVGAYSSGHRNSPGKLITEVALGLLPWLCAAVPAWLFALRNAVRRSELATACRFLTVAALPLIALLSFSSTVRDVYALPSMVPLTAAIAYWWQQRSGMLAQCKALQLTRVLMLTIGTAGILLGVLVAWVGDGGFSAGVQKVFVVIGLGALLCYAGARLSRERVILRGVGLFACGLCTFLLLAGPIIERGQDLRPVAEAAASAAGPRPLLLASGDETMAAALDYSSSLHGALTYDFNAALRSEPSSLALVEVGGDRLTPAMRERLATVAPWLRNLAPPSFEPAAQALFTAGWTVFLDLPNPGGRHYQLLKPPASLAES